jgi:large subunit ribosomal protein L30
MSPSGKRLRVTQIRSAIRRPNVQKATIRGLGIKKLNQPVEHNDTPAVRGMIAAVRHLLRVEEVDG